MYVYVQSEPGCYTVGHYTPDGKWIAESDHETHADAAARVAMLNGAGREESSAPGTPPLRDYFAGQALAGLLASQTATSEDGASAMWVEASGKPTTNYGEPDDYANLAYQLADAMMKARAK